MSAGTALFFPFDPSKPLQHENCEGTIPIPRHFLILTHVHGIVLIMVDVLRHSSSFNKSIYLPPHDSIRGPT